MSVRIVARKLGGAEVCVRTTVELDDALVEEALRLTGIRTKRELLDVALRSLVEARKRKSLLELRGKIRFAEGYWPGSRRESVRRN